MSGDFDVNFADLNIAASHDIFEERLYLLQSKGHEINSFFINTYVVTYKKVRVHPSVWVYGLACINGKE